MQIAEAWDGSPATPQMQLRQEEFRGGIGRAMLGGVPALRVTRPVLPRGEFNGLREGTFVLMFSPSPGASDEATGKTMIVGERSEWLRHWIQISAANLHDAPSPHSTPSSFFPFASRLRRKGKIRPKVLCAAQYPARRSEGRDTRKAYSPSMDRTLPLRDSIS